MDYTLHEMQIANLAAQISVGLPAGWRWAKVEDANRRDHFDLICQAFADIPGTHIPSWDHFQGRKLSSEDHHALLLIDDVPAAFYPACN